VLTNVVTSGAALAVWFFISSGAASPTSNLTVYLLGLGTTAGVAAMAAALIRPIRRAGISLNWRFQPRHPAVKQLVRLSGWTVGFAASNQVALLAVLTLARGSGEGAVSAYQYAFIFFQLPYGLIAVSIMTTVLPELSEAARNHDVDQYRDRFREGLGLLLVFLLPAAGALMFLGRPLIQVLLERGNFDHADTVETSRMLAGFAIGLPAFAVFLYCMRAFYALRNTRLPFYLNLFENFLNVLLVVPLVAIWDSIGLSLAYSIAYWVAAGVAIVVLNRKVPDLLGWSSAKIFTKSVVVAVVITLVGYAVDLAFQERVGPILQVVIPAAVVGPILVALVTIVKPLGFEDLNAAIRRRVNSRTG
jgi:putative peptidoglycan lipid II flippase